MPRIHIEGGLYLVTTRGGYGEELFKDDIDRAQYLELLSKYKEQFRFKIFSYVLMPAFVHLFIELAAGTTISDIMHVINTNYTKYFNSRYNRRGHLFRGRFKSCLVEKVTYLKEATRYTHRVPVQAGAAYNAADYKWSSYPVYIGTQKDMVGMGGDIKEVLNSLSSDPAAQIRLYKELMESTTKSKEDEFKKKLQTAWVIGSKIFVDGVKNRLKEDTKVEQQEKKREWVASKPHKTFITAGSTAIAILAVFTIYLYRANLGLVNVFETTLETKETEFIEKLKSEKKKLTQDLSEKYRADMVSFQAMKRRFEAEKEKAKEMENEIEELKKKTE